MAKQLQASLQTRICMTVWRRRQ